MGQFKRLKCEQCHFFFLQKWHWFAAFADPLWLIATIEYIALVTRDSQEKSRISSYLWLNDDGLPNLVSKQTEDGPHKVKKDGYATTHVFSFFFLVY